MVPPTNQNTVGVCNQITLLIVFHISSRLETILKVADVHKQVSGIFYFTVSFKFINFRCQIFLLLFLQCLLSSRVILFRLSTLLWFGFCNHSILACFLWSKNRKHSSSYHSVYCFSSYRHRLSIARGLVFYFMFSEALFMSSLPFKFSRTTDLFEIFLFPNFQFTYLPEIESFHIKLLYCLFLLPIFP